MLRSVLALLLLSLVPAAAPLRGPCDMKKIEKKAWCPGCAVYVPRGDVKAGSCPKDKTRIETHDLCVKSMYIPACHPEKKGISPVKCCGVVYDTPAPDEARILFKCPECGEHAFLVANVKHTGTCVTKTTKKMCEKSGQAPHSAGK